MFTIYISGNQYWFGLRKPPCQFLFGVCPCLQLFGNISYSLYSNHASSSMQTDSTVSNFNSRGVGGDGSGENIEDQNNDSGAAGGSGVRNGHTEISVVAGDTTSYLPNLGSSKKKAKKSDHIVVPALTLELPD